MTPHNKLADFAFEAVVIALLSLAVIVTTITVWYAFTY